MAALQRVVRVRWDALGPMPTLIAGATSKRPRGAPAASAIAAGMERVVWVGAARGKSARCHLDTSSCRGDFFNAGRVYAGWHYGAAVSYVVSTATPTARAISTVADSSAYERIRLGLRRNCDSSSYRRQRADFICFFNKYAAAVHR
jgi:hypothetical protein